MGLRSGQKELVELYKGGYCAVPAIPGGGKTYTLTMWAAEAITKGVQKPGKLLIVTYMNSAANSIKRRIAEELARRGIRGGKEYFVSTIHGLCLQVIKERPDLADTDEAFEIIDDTARARLAALAVEEWKAENGEKFSSFLEDYTPGTIKGKKMYEIWTDKLASLIIQTVIGSFKMRGMNPLKALEISRGSSAGALLSCSAEIYEKYEMKLKLMGFIDFDDMLLKAQNMLMNDSLLLEKYRKRYAFVCEDEAQDSNLIQSNILSMVAEDNFLRVGDSNQAICGTFTNSDPELFQNFCNDKRTCRYDITESSRSSSDIINLANHFVDIVREQHPVSACRNSLLPQYIRPVGPDDPFANPESPKNGIRTGIFSSWEEEAAAVTGQVWTMMEKFPGKTIAVLVPSYWKMDTIISRMEMRNIPYELLDNTSGERQSAVKKLGRAIDFIAHPADSQKLADFLYETFPSEFNEELIEIIKNSDIKSVLHSHSSKTYGTNLPEIQKAALEKLSIAESLLRYPIECIEKLIISISEVLDFSREEKAIAYRAADEIRRMIARNPRFDLEQLARELLMQRNIFTHFAGAVWELKGYEPQNGKVTISTYHKAKGLEWDIVFLTGLSSTDFPARLSDRFVGEYWFLKQQYKNPQAAFKAELKKALGDIDIDDPVLESKLETISEKARLLYVGITRAKEYLFLSSYHQNPGKKNEVLPSWYLTELKRYIDRILYSEGGSKA